MYHHYVVCVTAQRFVLWRFSILSGTNTTHKHHGSNHIFVTP